MRVEVVCNSDRRRLVLVVKDMCLEVLVKACCNKLKIHKKNIRIFYKGEELQNNDNQTFQDGDIFWLLMRNDEVYQGPPASDFLEISEARNKVVIIEGNDVYIDNEAVEQVHKTVLLSQGIISRAVGMPDLHHGPTGVAMLASNPIPKIPGYDIGCGMALFATNIPANITREKAARRMAQMNLDEGEDSSDPQLGTIGGGNHFAELLIIDTSVEISESLREIFNPENAYLLVHSGSRAHGERVFQTHNDGHDLEGYMNEHTALVHWAKRNRAIIAERFLKQFTFSGVSETLGERESKYLGDTIVMESPQQDIEIENLENELSMTNVNISESDRIEDPQFCEPCVTGGLEPLIDIAHNWIESLEDGNFLHRKGAAPSYPGSLSLLPGSRGTASYILICSGTNQHLHSVAHGAGRKLSRSEARKRVDPHLTDLTQGGTVICVDKDLLKEEAPSAYKDVDAVVECMISHGMCSIGARMLPVATYKTARCNC